MLSKGEILFEEEQYFRQPLLWLVILSISSFLTYAVVSQLILGVPVASIPMPNGILVVFWSVFGLGLPTLIGSIVLITRVYDDRVTVQFWPLHRSEISYNLQTIRKAIKVKYKPIIEFGGWGIRVSSRGKAYTISGNRGVQLYLEGSKPLIIGSRRSFELMETINRQLSGNDESAS